MSTMSVIDADGHVTETDEQIRPFLEGRLRDRTSSRPYYPGDGWDRPLGGRLGERAATGASWLEALDRGDMDSVVLYPTGGLFLGFVKDPEWAVTLARAYNSFVHEEFIRVSPRLKAVALLPVQDPDASAKELRRAVRELGLSGAMLAADGSHVLGDERFAGIYEEAQRLNVMLGIHASGSHLGGAGVDLFPRFIQAHAVSHIFGQMRQMTSIVLEGVLERFPDLKIGFLEAGAGWVPYFAERLDDEFAKRGEVEAPALKKKPSDYLRGKNVYISCEADEWLLPQAVKLLGEDKIVYASDFPHWDNSYPGSIEEIRTRGDLGDAQKRKILAENARRMYRLR